MNKYLAKVASLVTPANLSELKNSIAHSVSNPGSALKNVRPTASNVFKTQRNLNNPEQKLSTAPLSTTPANVTPLGANPLTKAAKTRYAKYLESRPEGFKSKDPRVQAAYLRTKNALRKQRIAKGISDVGGEAGAAHKYHVEGGKLIRQARLENNLPRGAGSLKNYFKIEAKIHKPTTLTAMVRRNPIKSAIATTLGLGAVGYGAYRAVTPD